MKDILLVDDEALFLASLAEGLKSICSRHYNIITARNGRKAVEILQNVKVDVIVTDLSMPEMNGFELIDYVKKQHPDISVIVMTAISNDGIESMGYDHRVKHVVEKPINLQDIAKRILAV
jgi:YesN/AraC family two-component response regulator